MQKKLFILLGWFFVILGVIGLLLPLLPTTPFLILALALFANSSPRFHQMLLDNRWFGTTLKNWEKNRTVSRRIKIRATLLIIVSFSFSILLLNKSLIIQIILGVIASVLLVILWSLKEDTKKSRY